MTNSSSRDKIIVGALSAAATIIFGFLAYNTFSGRKSALGEEDTHKTATRQRHHRRQRRQESAAVTDSVLMDLEQERKLMSKALRATLAKDLLSCIDILDKIIERFPRSFEAYLLRARCPSFAQELCRNKNPDFEAEDIEKVQERVAHIDREADLRVAKQLASNDAQHVIVDSEMKIGHLEEKDLQLPLLEGCLEEIDRVMQSDEKWAQYDLLLLERINLYVGCITNLNSQMEDPAIESQEDLQKLQDRMVEYIVKLTKDCDKVVECSKNDEFLANAYYYRATFMEMGSPDQLVCISKCIAKLPEFIDALMMRAQLYFSTFEDVPRALSDFERVLKLEPNNVDALFYKAACLIKQGITRESTTETPTETTADSADTTASPASAAATSSAATARGTAKTTSSGEVVAMLENVLKMQPDHFDAASVLCDILQVRGEVHKAPEVIQKQIELLKNKAPFVTLLSLHLLLAEYLLSSQQFDECARICNEQAMLIDEKKPSDTSEENTQRIELTQKNLRALRRYALSVRDSMPKFPKLDEKFAGQRAPFMEHIDQKELREMELKEEDETEEKTLSEFIDCVIYLFTAGTSHVSMYQGLDRFKEIISQENRKGVTKACRNGFFLTQFFSDYIMRGEAGQCFVVDPNFVNTLEQLLQSEKEGKGVFYESLDQFLMQIVMIAEQRRRQQQQLLQQQLLASVQQQQL